MSLQLFAALGDSSKYVETQTNTPDQLTPVLSINPKDGVGVLFRNRVDVGDKAGIPIYGKFLDSNGNPLPADTRVAIGYQAPTDESIQVVSDPKSTIASYIKNSVSDQQDDRRVDAVKHALKGKGLEVRDIDEAYILVDSTEQIDHSQSEIYLEESALAEVDLE
ncbi:small major capsid protein [Haloterrigena jeotgali icosahedral virus 1]|uniref:Uncharacterized protein n=2 Tax=root TaxID=1 RepID=A0AAF0T8I2_9EURY|nr:hypothetical protein [Natrinema thermotolerans]YP_010772660.1 small major capsid protein [Haloterrigena jeotgali icosahedral virus 1]QCC57395.1 hypothetical protein DVR14_01570 [Natrinema thermotolerans]WMT10369.1 hypothetical protein NP511_22830 [Natrinema thermotolerans]WPH65814.1 hypothetical protein HJIV1_gp23 [Haloterrigena jeotgali icosahedral virus 1]DAC85300.1 TPA_asm: small major capsid protein [Haloterrigena jeotgali icosahedral virus 1]